MKKALIVAMVALVLVLIAQFPREAQKVRAAPPMTCEECDQNASAAYSITFDDCMSSNPGTPYQFRIGMCADAGQRAYCHYVTSRCSPCAGLQTNCRAGGPL